MWTHWDLASEYSPPSFEPYAAGASRSKRCHIGGRAGFVESAGERKTKRAQWLRSTLNRGLYKLCLHPFDAAKTKIGRLPKRPHLRGCQWRATAGREPTPVVSPYEEVTFLMTPPVIGRFCGPGITTALVPGQSHQRPGSPATPKRQCSVRITLCFCVPDKEVEVVSEPRHVLLKALGKRAPSSVNFGTPKLVSFGVRCAPK